MRSVAIGLAAVALLAGCGGSGGSGSAQPAGSIAVTMTEFKFDPSTISHASGKVVFWLINSGTTQHDLAIRDSSGKTLATSELVSAGDTLEFDVADIAAGTYTFYCSQPGHEASGMKGTLTIT
ncbi:MAG TPA: plastocyanin/azurin family copper-binding protein [Candidatus Limnocylindrales bacterium]|nr:plastocyanin/azurin family copper-binding protein [Candidatus Limnocylindrales bacterium]